MTSPNPFVFLVGCPRSGTTLLRRMLDAHPDVAVTPETHWIPELFEERRGLDTSGAVTEELARALGGHRKFPRLGMTLEEVTALAGQGEEVSYAGYVSRVFDLYGRKRGKPLVGDKTPGYVRRIDALNELWPRARYVQLVRDGRDVCLSVLEWDRASRTAGRFATWAQDRLSTAALWWEWNVRLGREAGERLAPGLYLEVTYEALVSEPEPECARLCDFLGLPFHASMVRYHEGRTRTKPGLDAKHAWLPPTAGLRDWRSDMQWTDLERFEAVAGGLLEELGYERAAARPRPETVAAASRVRTAFVDELRARGRPVPRALGTLAGERAAR